MKEPDKPDRKKEVEEEINKTLKKLELMGWYEIIDDSGSRIGWRYF